MRPEGTLLTADIICFGVPTPAAFQSYLCMLEQKAGKRVIHYAHRGSGIRDRGPEFAVYEDGAVESSTMNSLAWSRIWYNNLIRESCYRCGWHSPTRPGDVTLGDYWGLENIKPDIKDSWGTSLLMVNSLDGLELVRNVSDSLNLLTTPVRDAVNSKQPMLIHPPKRMSRMKFWRVFNARGFSASCHAVGAIGFTNAVRTLAKRIVSSGTKLDDRAASADADKAWGIEPAVDFDGIGQRGEYPVVFAARNRDEKVRRMSSSGGVFHALASHAIEDLGGVVYGCAFDDKLRARHIRCETMAEAERCMGSKYSQSDMGDTIPRVRGDLAAGRVVLFTGTPCQVAAVRAACGNVSGGANFG